jgi:hypothetical protein
VSALSSHALQVQPLGFFSSNPNLSLDNVNQRSKTAIEYNISLPFTLDRSWDSAVGTVTDYRLDNQGVEVPSPGRVKNFLLSTSSRPVLRPTLPPIEGVLGLFPWS